MSALMLKAEKPKELALLIRNFFSAMPGKTALVSGPDSLVDFDSMRAIMDDSERLVRFLDASQSREQWVLTKLALGRKERNLSHEPFRLLFAKLLLN